MAVALAVIAKENYPLYVRTASPGNELKFLYTIHTSIDVIEEKISSISKTAGDLRELYLGLLYPTEDYKVYGYVTNTKIKLVVVVESSHLVLRDNEIRQMFRRIHSAYTDMVCDPFYVPGETVVSKSFENVIKGIISSE